MIALTSTRDRSVFKIRAGSASGIQVGAELGVYSGNMTSTAKPLARLVATHVTPTEATLSAPETGTIVELPQDAYVVVVKYNDQAVRILVNNDSTQPEVWKQVFQNLSSLSVDIVWTKPGEASDLVIAQIARGIEIHRQDPSLIQLELRSITFPYSLGVPELTRRLAAMVYFHFHLQRRNPDSPLKGRIRMKLVELNSQFNPSLGWAEFVPPENAEDLFGESLLTGAVARLQASADKRYGLAITNNSNWNLFAYVLYFDLEDYSITLLYCPPGRSTDPPLLNTGQELTVGYGSGGAEPLRVESTGFSGKEAGLFVLFVSSTWVDMSHLEQASPFERSRESDIEIRGQGKDVSVKTDSSAWDVVVVGVSIVQ
jgi:hypothetical protein